MNQLTKPMAIGILLGTGLIGFLIANLGVNYTRMELGALAPLFVQPFVVFMALVLFLLLDWLLPKARVWILLMLILTLLIISISIRMDII